MTHTMVQTKAGTIFSILFVLALASPAAFGALQVHLDPNTAERGDEEAINHGAAGGKLFQADDKPDWDSGTIDVNGASVDTAWWFTTGARQVWTTPDNTPTDETISFNTENYTMGLLLKINGPLWEQEHHLLGIQSDAPEANQTTRIWVNDEEAGCLGGVNVMQPAIGLREDYPTEDHGLCPGLDTWAWIHIAFESGIAITFYVNGEVTGDLPSGVTWDPARPMNLLYLFSHSFGEQQRTFNGSIASYKVWDEWMDQAAIQADLGSVGGAVESAGKLTTTWAAMRTQ
jgi:hypothetical protein